MEQGFLKKSAKRLAIAVAAGLFVGIACSTPKMIDFYQATHSEPTLVIDATGGPSAGARLIPPQKHSAHHRKTSGI
jgi:hypothetical protein